MKSIVLLCLAVCVSATAFARTSADDDDPNRSLTIDRTGSLTDADLVTSAATQMALGYAYDHLRYAKEDRLQWASKPVCTLLQPRSSLSTYGCTGKMVSTKSQFETRLILSVHPTNKGLEDVARFGLMEPSQLEVSIEFREGGAIRITNSINQATALVGFIADR